MNSLSRTFYIYWFIFSSVGLAYSNLNMKAIFLIMLLCKNEQILMHNFSENIFSYPNKTDFLCPIVFVVLSLYIKYLLDRFFHKEIKTMFSPQLSSESNL